MKVNEIFYSLQGEGARVGEPTVFVRLAGCDLACGFCDTEFESGMNITDSTLMDMVLGHVRKLTGEIPWLAWTGGEPMLQLTQPTVSLFHQIGFKQSIETNGNHPVPLDLDWVVCSPKVAEHVLAKHFPKGVDELRYVRHTGQMSVPAPKITAKRYYLSPMFDGNRVNNENLKHCVKLCLENPKWSLSLQTHKLIKIL